MALDEYYKDALPCLKQGEKGTRFQITIIHEPVAKPQSRWICRQCRFPVLRYPQRLGREKCKNRICLYVWKVFRICLVECPR